MFEFRYRDDPGLAFLQFCSPGDLQDLADILMMDKGARRLTEQLSEPYFTGTRNDLTMPLASALRCRAHQLVPIAEAAGKAELAGAAVTEASGNATALCRFVSFALR